MTLVELLIGTALFVGGGGALLLGMHYSMIHSSYLHQEQLAINDVQGTLEQISAMPFDTIWEDGGGGGIYGAARTSQMALPLDALPGGSILLQIRPVPLGNPNPSLLDIAVAACWTHRNRAIGERTAGVCGDGADANWWVDSSVMVSTRVARRD